MKFDRNTSTAAVRRLRAVLALRGESLATFATRLCISDVHLRQVVAGMRVPSARLRDALAHELGTAAWSYVRGEVDVLGEPG